MTLREKRSKNSNIPTNYLIICLFILLCSKFQTSTRVFNVFNSHILISRHVAKMEIKIKVFPKFIHRYWFYSANNFLFRQNKHFHKYFTAIFDNFRQNFTKITKNHEISCQLGGKQNYARAPKFLTNTLKYFGKRFRRMIFSDKKHLFLKKIRYDRYLRIIYWIWI